MSNYYYSRVTSVWDESLQRYVTHSLMPHRYVGPVALCKGDDTAKKAEQQQAAFNAQLMSIFSQQFAKQSAVFEYLKGKMQPIIDAGGKGLSDDALAAMRTGATDQISTAYQNAQRALQNKEFSQGGRDLPSGVNAQLDEALMNAQAADKSTAQNNITLNDENLKQQNYWNALNVLNGVATSYNPLGYANSATAGSGAVANLSQAVTAANGPGWGSIVGGIAGAGLSAAGSAGGFGKLFGCWIAAKIFNGKLDPRTLAVRSYIHGKFAQSWYGSILSKLYMKYGEWIAEQKILVTMLKPVFHVALVKARA